MYNSLKTESCYDTNFVVTGGNDCCHKDNPIPPGPVTKSVSGRVFNVCELTHSSCSSRTRSDRHLEDAGTVPWLFFWIKVPGCCLLSPIDPPSRCLYYQGHRYALHADVGATVKTWWRHFMEMLLRITGLLWGESTGKRWFPFTKGPAMRSFWNFVQKVLKKLFVYHLFSFSRVEDNQYLYHSHIVTPKPGQFQSTKKYFFLFTSLPNPSIWPFTDWFVYRLIHSWVNLVKQWIHH